MRRTLATLALLLLPFCAAATPPAARIADVAWIAGYWVGEGMGGSIEDIFMPPGGGLMLGAFRLIDAKGKPVFHELLAIEEHEGSLRLVIKHFHPDWTGWEEKDKFVNLPLVRLTADEASFGGVGYRREGGDILWVDLRMRQKDGSLKEQKLQFRRKPL